MIETINLTRCYGDFKAVDNVSFNIGAGEIVGLLGHNGAGKTTIMKMLTGYIEASSGDALIDGCNITDDRLRIQSKIGYLPENCPVYPEMTVIDYLQYAANLKGIIGQSAREAVRYSIQQTDLNAKATDLISTLSRGYRQRVGVAQAILTRPEILILDEPTNGLDPSQIQHMRELILNFGEQSTVIVSTHIMQEVQAICDRVLVMRQGQLALDSKLDALQKSQRLSLMIDQKPDIANSKLNEITGIQSLVYDNSHSQHNRYILELSDNMDIQEVAARVAKTIISEGYQLYALSPVRRDLETVFKEINSNELIGGQLNAE